MNPNQISNLITDDINNNNGLLLEHGVKKDPARFSELITKLRDIKKEFMSLEDEEKKKELLDSGIKMIHTAYQDELIPFHKAMGWIQVTFPGVRIEFR